MLARFDWQYDNLSRLTAETFDLGNDGSSTGDYVTAYVYDDLNGPGRDSDLYPYTSGDTYEYLNDNRQIKSTQHDYSGSVGGMTPDETVTYTYDADGRLLQEQDVKVVDSCSTVTTNTVYQYGSNNSRTEQTAKTTYDDSNNVVTQETWAYDLAGRMVEDAVSTDGGETSVTTNFVYDDDGNRVIKAIDGGEQTAYLVDINNLTGYPQTLVETLKASDGTTISATSYTFGWDAIGQSVKPVGGDEVNSLFLADAHGSVRGLLSPTSPDMLVAGKVSPAGSDVKVLTYDAFGNALGFDISSAGTSLLYSGEFFDKSISLQYLRSRWYDARSGRFTSFDSYQGDPYTPQSFNAYGYCQANPVSWVDPSGNNALGEMTQFGMANWMLRTVVMASVGGLTGGIYKGGQAALCGADGKTIAQEMLNGWSEGVSFGLLASLIPGGKWTLGSLSALGLAGSVAGVADGINQIQNSQNPNQLAVGIWNSAWSVGGSLASGAGLVSALKGPALEAAWGWLKKTHADECGSMKNPFMPKGGGGFEKMKQGNNIQKNKDFEWVKKKLGLSDKQARELHEDITGQGMSKDEILEHAKNMFPEKAK